MALLRYTNLKNYLSIHLMFLSNDSFHFCVAAAHVRLVIFPRHTTLLFCQKLSCSKQGSKKHAVCKQTIFEEMAATKSESRQVHYPRKFIPRKLQKNFSNFWQSTKYYSLKIHCLMVSEHNAGIIRSQSD